jgi:hypothetical protein
MFALPWEGISRSFRAARTVQEASPVIDDQITGIAMGIVIGFALLGLAVLFAFVPGLYYLWVFGGVVPLAWACLRALKYTNSLGPLPGTILLSHLTAGLLNVLAGVYFLATLLNTPGWTMGELLVEAPLVCCFVFVGVQAVEVVIRCYHAQVHGVPRRDEVEAPETFGEVTLSTVVKLARKYAFHAGLLLCLGVLTALVVEWLRTGKWPGRGTSIPLLLLIVWCAKEVVKKKWKPAASDTGAGEKSS